ncbi:SEC-C domain-containing protein [Candidatus Woesearchaeota archaeon]|nr:SEC-C domain-containing protein [Candidatus Woesearchaeota archaeon]
MNKTINPNKIDELILQLQRFDNPKGYRMKYEKIKGQLMPAMDELASYGEESLTALHHLLKYEESWSCLFALQTLQKIKSPKSIPILIKFIKDNDDGEYWESGEDAMLALTAIGEPAIWPLLQEIKDNFSKEEYYTFLVGGLVDIKHETVYQFMLETLKDYLNNYNRYDSWFDLVSFIMDFDKQENKEVILFLEQLYEMKHLSKEEKREIKDTIEIIRDPAGFQERLQKEIESTSEKLKEDFKDAKSPCKLKLDKEDFLERAGQADDDFEVNFKCQQCGQRQNLKTGMIWQYYKKDGKDDFDENNFSFEHEIMCTSCDSHNLKPSDKGRSEILSKNIRILAGKDRGILPVGQKIIVENKKMDFDKCYDYVLGRIKEEPNDGELYLRAGNCARKNNFYDEAISHYQKSLELEPDLIASYMNLIEIYLHRWKHYSQKGAEQLALDYFSQMVELFNSNQYNLLTISKDCSIPECLTGFAEHLGLSLKRRKIGRNDPCPCGSGKKYKKCCLSQESFGVSWAS